MVDGGWECTVLDSSIVDRKADVVDPSTRKVILGRDQRAVGVTGTGVVAALYCGMYGGLIPNTPTIETEDGRIHLQDGVCITSHDVEEAGKAIGALRAGFLTLLLEAGLWTGDVKKAYMDTIPLRRFGTADDIAKAVAWLAGDEASYVTGQIISVNGGMIG